MLDAAERVNDGLAQLSAARGIKLFRLDPDWYGFDPIHIRRSLWRPAWEQILGVTPPVRSNGAPWAEGLRLYLMRPERRWMWGVEQFTSQSSVALPSGGSVWLY